MFAGDSGNDVAALIAGYLTIVVGNAAENVRERVHSEHRKQGWNDRLHLAVNDSTSGVLEGCREFGLFQTCAQRTLNERSNSLRGSFSRRSV